MNARAGLVTSQAAWLISLPVAAAAPTPVLSAKGALAGFVVAGFASFLPDLDHPGSTVGRYVPARARKALGGHRMGAHSIAAVVVSWWLCGFLVDDPIVARAMAIGWASHVCCDLLTVQGVALLYPFSRRKFHIGWMVTGSKSEDRYMLFLKILMPLVAMLYVGLAIRGGYFEQLASDGWSAAGGH